MRFANGICIITDDVRKLAEFYSKVLQAEFVAVPTTYPWGSRAMHFRDPDG